MKIKDSESEKIKKLFPITKKVIYLDNAATSLTHPKVIEELSKFLERKANIHRGAHWLSQEATEKYEKAREKIAKALNAKPEEIFFTKNATEGLNALAFMLKNKKTAVTIAEHHSNFLPWKRWSKSFHTLKLDEEQFPIFEKGYEIYAITHASNVTGNITDIKAFVDEKKDALLVVDGAQAYPHLKVDVKKLDVDAYTFSAHKCLGPTGLGVVFIREDLAEKLEPLLVGGGMVFCICPTKEVKYKEHPHKFEAGTPPIGEAIAFSSIIEILEEWKEEYKTKEQKLMKYIMENMPPSFSYVGTKDYSRRTPLISFYHNILHSHDIGDILNEKHIAIRAGYHCAQPLHDYLSIPPTARASLYFYNTKEEVEKLIEALDEIDKRYK